MSNGELGRWTFNRSKLPRSEQEEIPKNAVRVGCLWIIPFPGKVDTQQELNTLKKDNASKTK